MGSTVYDSYRSGWYPARGQRVNMGTLYACTCGAYQSILPPEPCPMHDPERAYWRRKLLAEFGGHETTTTTNTASITTETHKLFHYMNKPDAPLAPRETYCGVEAGAWTRVKDWVTCKECKKKMEAE